MAYTNIKKSSDYFNTKLYTGNGSTQSITGVGFQPDMLWGKNRSTITNHELTDVVRGINQRLKPNDTDADQTNTTTFTSFDSDGFTVGSNQDVNNNGSNQVVWSWKANGTGVANTDGSISSTVSANTTSGFSIVSYSGSNSNSTVGHGLGVAPRVIIIKRLNVADNWRVLHMSAGNDNTAHLNLTSAFSSSAVFQNTSPTSSVFSLVGNNASVNQSGSTYIAYCFADVQGFSKFGSYTGNGSTDGTFVYTGFAPAWVMIKRTNSVNDWLILDTKRNPINPSNERILANTNAAASTANTMVDFLSNGFKPRSTYGGINGDSDNFIYMAFAESPLVNSNGIPNNAQ